MSEGGGSPSSSMMVPTGPVRIIPEVRQRDEPATRAAITALDELWVVTDELRRIESRYRDLGRDQQDMSLVANERETWWASALERAELLARALEALDVDAAAVRAALERARTQRPRTPSERIALLDDVWTRVDAGLKAGPPPELSDDTGFLLTERKKHGRWSLIYTAMTFGTGALLALSGGGPKVVSRLVVVIAACGAGAIYETVRWHKVRTELDERNLLSPPAR